MTFFNIVRHQISQNAKYSVQKIGEYLNFPQNVKNYEHTKKKRLPAMKKLFYDEYSENIKSSDQPNDIDNFKEFYYDWKSEVKTHSKAMRLKTIERKYFRDLKPLQRNLMTWDMKEHLLQLHAMDPETWDPNALSQIFPITPEGVKRFLKHLHKSPSPEEVKKHDKQVLQNWNELTKGQIGNVTLLKKIVNRRLSELQSNLPAQKTTRDCNFLDSLIFTPIGDEETPIDLPDLPQQRKPVSVFKDIITRYNERANGNRSDADEVGLTKCEDLDAVLPQASYASADEGKLVGINLAPEKYGKRRRRIITYDEFKARQQKR